MDAKQQIGRRIKALRQMRGFSQEGLAEVIGVNPKYLSSIERGRENPTLDLFIRLAKGLNVSVQEIFFIENVAEEPRQLRRRLRALTSEISDQELARAIRVIEGLIR